MLINHFAVREPFEPPVPLTLLRSGAWFNHSIEFCVLLLLNVVTAELII